MNLKANPIILFQGDSITDAGRKRKNSESLGDGYAMLAAAWISALHPELNAKFINRGIAGNRVRDLRSRWKKDCLDLKPDLVSILIGINDSTGRPFWSKSVELQSFRSDYEIILQAIANAEIKIVLMEPFVLPSAPNYKETLKNLEREVEVVRVLSKQFNAKLVPLQDIFGEAVKRKDPTYWTLDGVHPTLAGHALIAQAWIKGFTE